MGETADDARRDAGMGRVELQQFMSEHPPCAACGRPVPSLIDVLCDECDAKTPEEELARLRERVEAAAAGLKLYHLNVEAGLNPEADDDLATIARVLDPEGPFTREAIVTIRDNALAAAALAEGGAP